MSILSICCCSDDTVDTWSVEPSNHLPNGRSYYEDQVLDPRIEYKIMVSFIFTGSDRLGDCHNIILTKTLIALINSINSLGGFYILCRLGE